MIPFLDLKAINLAHADALRAAFDRVLNSGWFILGAETEAFEQEWASYCGARHSVGVANGLDALSLSLRALDIGDGDDVLVPSNTYIASWLAVTQVGARPVPVEPDPRTYNLDPSRLESAITPRTRAIMPVHLYGQSASLDPILEVARRHGLRVIEDAAQAHGASYKGRRIGAHGDVVAWSFYPGKNLGALGDGGAITTNDAQIADRVRVLRNYGSRAKYHNEVIGWNSRLDELQAALLRAKLPFLERENSHRATIAELYNRCLAGLGLELPYIAPDCVSAWHLYVVRHPQRDRFARELHEAGIGTVIHYPVPPHLQPAYASLGFGVGSLPTAETLHAQVFSLPIGPSMSLAQAEEVVDSVRRTIVVSS
jgi:dTDP-4-amino-4,6-dideoxygalactose transaminase